jgi:hypothetical protein
LRFAHIAEKKRAKGRRARKKRAKGRRARKEPQGNEAQSVDGGGFLLFN